MGRTSKQTCRSGSTSSLIDTTQARRAGSKTTETVQAGAMAMDAMACGYASQINIHHGQLGKA